MANFLFLMHDDAPETANADWEAYFTFLRRSGRFEGGSAIGGGACFRKEGPVPGGSDYLTGYIKVEAEDLADARTLLVGNPVYEAGGTVEIRELPKT